MRKLIYLLLLFSFTLTGQRSSTTYYRTATVTPVAPTFEPEYQAVLDYGTLLGYTLPSASQQVAQNQIIKTLKDSAIWDSIDVFYMYANNGSKDFGLINWKDTSDFNATISAGITWKADTGFVGGASTDRISTGFNPSILNQATTAFGLDSCSYGLWIFDLGTGDNYLGWDFSMNLLRQGGGTTRLTSGVSSTITMPTSGWISLHRKKFETFSYNLDGIFTDVSANGALDVASLANEPFEILNRATRDLGSNATISAGYIGGYLGNNIIYNAINTYMSGL